MYVHVRMCQDPGLSMQMLQDGRCKTLDAAADGYMRGEACVVHLLHAAQPGSDELCALPERRIIIKGTAVNQDGRSSSLTVSSAC